LAARFPADSFGLRNKMTKQPREMRDGAQVVRRVFGLLKEISASQGKGARLSALAEAAGLPSSTTHRLLNALLAEGVVERDQITKGFRLGPLLYEFGLAATPRVNIRTFCSTALDRIAEASGHTAYLNCRSGFDALCLDKRAGWNPIQSRSHSIGNRRPLGVGAAALAVLSSMPTSEVDEVLEANETRYRRYGLSVERVRSSVEGTKARGFSVTCGRFVARHHGVGLAIPNGVGGVPVALSLIAVEDRLDPRTVEQAVTILRKEEQVLRALLNAKPPSSRRGDTL
jgi:DNA-binding IclR family transcriptional regulator